MNILYCFLTETSEVIFTNMSIEKTDDVKRMECKYESSSMGRKRWLKEKKKCNGGFIYLEIDDSAVTKKLFSRHMLFVEAFFKEIFENRNQLQKNIETKVRRLKHNIANHCAKMQDELEEIIPSDFTEKKDNWIESVKKIRETIASNYETSARTLLRVLKYVKMLNAELNVYDVVNSENTELNFLNHSIRKVVDLSIQPFFLDFLEKRIHPDIGKTTSFVRVDFPTVSVVLSHIWDNAVKYCYPGDPFSIVFKENETDILVVISMTSLLVEKNEIEKIYIEKYSGKWSKEYDLNGDGIGMFYVKKLMELNKGSIRFIPGEEKFKFDNKPYAENVIELQFTKVKQSLASF